MNSGQDANIFKIEHGGCCFAHVIRAAANVSTSTFYSDDSSSFQLGLLAHGAGFVEAAHYHPRASRTITDLQQMFVVQRGVVAVDFFDAEGQKVDEVVLRAGDAILLMHGIHSVRVLEAMQCISVKQGPFLGADKDKVTVDVKP